MVRLGAWQAAGGWLVTAVGNLAAAMRLVDRMLAEVAAVLDEVDADAEVVAAGLVELADLASRKRRFQRRGLANRRIEQGHSAHHFCRLATRPHGLFLFWQHQVSRH